MSDAFYATVVGSIATQVESRTKMPIKKCLDAAREAFNIYSKECTPESYVKMVAYACTLVVA